MQSQKESSYQHNSPWHTQFSPDKSRSAITTQSKRFSVLSVLYTSTVLILIVKCNFTESCYKSELLYQRFPRNCLISPLVANVSERTAFDCCEQTILWEWISNPWQKAIRNTLKPTLDFIYLFIFEKTFTEHVIEWIQLLHPFHSWMQSISVQIKG